MVFSTHWTFPANPAEISSLGKIHKIEISLLQLYTYNTRCVRSQIFHKRAANEYRYNEQNPAIVQARASARSLSISMCFYCVS